MKNISISIKNWRTLNQIKQREGVRHHNEVISGLILCYEELRKIKEGRQ